MKTINYDRLIIQIYKLKKDKRFKDNIEAIAALEEIIYWAEEETVQNINDKL